MFAFLGQDDRLWVFCVHPIAIAEDGAKKIAEALVARDLNWPVQWQDYTLKITTCSRFNTLAKMQELHRAILTIFPNVPLSFRINNVSYVRYPNGIAELRNDTSTSGRPE